MTEKNLHEGERQALSSYTWQVCEALGKYFKDRNFAAVPERERVDGIIDILKHGYHPAERFAKRFPQFLSTGQEAGKDAVSYITGLLGFKVITRPENQEECRKRLEEEVLIH